ncbi:hypothetical protein [Paracoccus spongiarum]|uniref:Uncharacterized protein n=1 Tax=Paracoccus spongiarum TaxID=3064387 RepID=A0ABT9JGT4_9RHOB|nr:hypothetical protein [Paracoccus sp. 2205BS29-5]MDP5309022.1 hypothetical protein [Paracoccus sp. 2205BS29-5]
MRQTEISRHVCLCVGAFPSGAAADIRVVICVDDQMLRIWLRLIDRSCPCGSLIHRDETGNSWGLVHCLAGEGTMEELFDAETVDMAVLRRVVPGDRRRIAILNGNELLIRRRRLQATDQLSDRQPHWGTEARVDLHVTSLEDCLRAMADDAPDKKTRRPGARSSVIGSMPLNLIRGDSDLKLPFRRIRVSAKPSILSLNTPRKNDDEFVHPYIMEFPDGFNGFRYLLAVTGFEAAREKLENPYIFGSNNLENFFLLHGVRQPIFSPITEGDGHNSDVALAYDFGTSELLCLIRQTHRLRGRAIDTGDIIDSISFRATRDGVNWSEPCEILRSTRDKDPLLSPSLLHDPNDGRWHLFTVSRPHILHRSATDLRGPWTEPDLIHVPGSIRPHHIEMKWIGQRLFCLLHSKSSHNLHFGASENWTNFQFDQEPVLMNSPPSVYKGSFLPCSAQDGIRIRLFWTPGAGTIKQRNVYHLFRSEVGPFPE